jgi:hypothetical protein
MASSIGKTKIVNQLTGWSLGGSSSFATEVIIVTGTRPPSDDGWGWEGETEWGDYDDNDDDGDGGNSGSDNTGPGSQQSCIDQSEGYFDQCKQTARDNFDMLRESCNRDNYNCDTFASEMLAYDLSECNQELSEDEAYCEDNFPEE